MIELSPKQKRPIRLRSSQGSQEVSADLTLRFRFCEIELHLDRQLAITRFPDGTEAHATPHDTPEYHAHAIEKTSVDNPMLYCWQHDVWHIVVAELKGHNSSVLWAVAHGESTDTPECLAEENEAQALQRALQMRTREKRS